MYAGFQFQQSQPGVASHLTAQSSQFWPATVFRMWKNSGHKQLRMETFQMYRTTFPILKMRPSLIQ